jgi:hypothetical protein
MAVVSTERLREMELVDATGERIGSLRDLLLEPGSGRVRYAVVAVGQHGLAGALGLGERVAAIPYQLLRVESGQLMLPRNAASLADAPSFAPGHPPDFDRPYEEQLARYWGIVPYWEHDFAEAERLTAGDLADGSALAVPASADLHMVARALTAQLAGAAIVTDEQGRPLGLVTLREVSAALGRPPEITRAVTTAPSPRAAAASAEPSARGSHGWVEEGATGAGQSDQPAMQPAGVDVSPDVAGAPTAPMLPSTVASGAAAPAGRGGTPTGPAGTETPEAVTVIKEAQPSGSPSSVDGSSAGDAKCPACAATNRQGAGFCARCGARLR